MIMEQRCRKLRWIQLVSEKWDMNFMQSLERPMDKRCHSPSYSRHQPMETPPRAPKTGCYVKSCWVCQQCPNITFTLSDKDVSEINAFRHCIPGAKHQLCYWHAVKYLETRLKEDTPPAAYDPRRAHDIFQFIDPTWAPGITRGWLEDGVHEDDAEVLKPSDNEYLERILSGGPHVYLLYSFDILTSAEIYEGALEPVVYSKPVEVVGALSLSWNPTNQNHNDRGKRCYRKCFATCSPNTSLHT